MMPRLLERLYSSKRMLVVVVYLSMFLDNILLTVVVPIIPDYLYTSEQKEYVPTAQPYSESNDNKISSKEVALTNSSTLEQCLENSIPSDISPAVKHAQESSLHKEEMGTMKNRDIFWNMELEDHGHQIQTSEEQNNTGQDSVLQNRNAHAHSDCGPSHKQQAALSNCNFSSGSREQDSASSGASGIFTSHGIIDENGRVGVLLSSKALVQLVMNPVVGAVTAHVGYHLPLFMGSINLLVAALLFAFGEHFMTLLLARSLQGIASACISVSGMCLVAEQFPDDVVRSKVMGIVLGSMAVGVLLGYPFGSLLYDFVGKMAPFIVISVAVLLNGVLQLFLLDLKPVPDRLPVSTSWHRLLSDGHIVLIAGAIWLSTSTMAILEPCMPIWLMDNIKPQKWQLGMVFIPDSVGYLLGTNLFGPVAYNMGRWRVAVSAMMLVGLSTVLVPSAGSVGQLAIPHFGLGLGIGVVDAALVPLLASLMDSRYAAHYGSVYALQQMAVSLAYSLGPLVGGEMVRAVGFPWLMRSVGLLNLLYCPLLIFTSHDVGIPVTMLNSSLMADAPAVNYKTSSASDQTASNSKALYRQFLNSEDSD
ncbi:hypothetical protein Cfor_01169 [Coptotermes formosanus]|uniref:Major facilitator superfamily (MFS) profile domain-containing protein n=1 Tax=Coptotermes formosanus TaxID=36987 RepID=A0A6L2PTB3_COPFO|nr:hypothetical protein Cfor_01169 [Coptotermes formosanus]